MLRALAPRILAVLVVGAAGGVAVGRLANRFPGNHTLIFGTFLALVFVVVFSWRLRAAYSQARVANRGLLLIQQGRFVEAVELMKKGGRGGTAATVLATNQGAALLSLWRLNEAKQAYIRIPRRGAKRLGLASIGMPGLALVCALRNKPTDANRWIQECEKAGGGSTGFTVIARAVVEARADKWDEARELLRRYEVSLLGGPTRALADALYAWAVENTAGEKRHVDPVALFGEGSSAGLKAAWPELVEFVERAPKA